ncbi:MAG TPA: class I SAM-dependent methyltransferase [Chloroflexota bacterium]|jgi:SAM-dependent methyltransferase
MAVEAIYEHPDHYDLEVASREVKDLEFWRTLLLRERPVRVLEVGSGTGRLTLPLARLGSKHGFSMTGLELEPTMIQRARAHAAREQDQLGDVLQYIEGDIRLSQLPESYDAILLPYGVGHHLVDLDDQLTAWRNIRRHLAPGGLLAIDLEAPDFSTLSRALTGTGPRPDLDIQGSDGQRIRRSAASHYEQATQLATHAFYYNVTSGDDSRDQYASEFAMHVYFPREVELLCRATGFTVERMLGSYAGEPFGDHSRVMIALARATTLA